MWFPDLLLLLAGGALLLFGLSRLRRKRLLQDTPTSTIRGVAMGMAELSGKAVERTPVISPLTTTPCVWWRFTIEQEQTGAKGERKWVKVNEGCSIDLFYLDDGTGRILVDPMGAEMKIDFRRQWYGAAYDPVAGTGASAAGLLLAQGGNRRRYTEWLILPTGKLYLFGHVKGVRDAAAERKERLTQALRDLKADKERLAAFDADQDGRISAGEWDAAVEATKKRIIEEELAEGRPVGREDPDSRMMCKGPDERTYVISDTGEQGAIGSLSWTGYPSLAGGALLGLAGLASLLSRIGIIAGGWTIPWRHFLD